MLIDTKLKKKLVGEMALLAIEGAHVSPKNQTGESPTSPIHILSAKNSKKSDKGTAEEKDLLVKTPKKENETPEKLLKKRLTLLQKIKNRARLIPEYAGLVDNIQEIQDTISKITDPFIHAASKLVLTESYFENLTGELKSACDNLFKVPRLDVDNNASGYFQPTRTFTNYKKQI